MSDVVLSCQWTWLLNDDLLAVTYDSMPTLTEQKSLAESEQDQDGDVVDSVLLGGGQADDYQYPGAEEYQEED